MFVLQSQKGRATGAPGAAEPRGGERVTPSESKLRGRLPSGLRVGAICAFVLLMTLAGMRIYTWRALGENTRLLTLVNPWNPLTETGYTAKLTTVENGFRVDRACADALERMLADCRSAGKKPVLTTAYRSMDDQLVLFDGEIQRLVETGLSPEDAETAVLRTIARPGRSEHELGLAVDIVDADYTVEDETQSTTPTAHWLAENAWRYGFILRYPEGAEEITGYGWQPWHYRYVGEEAAGNIYSLGITLEEYLSLFYSEEAAVEVDTAA